MLLLEFETDSALGSIQGSPKSKLFIIIIIIIIIIIK